MPTQGVKRKYVVKGMGVTLRDEVDKLNLLRRLDICAVEQAVPLTCLRASLGKSY